MFTPDVVSLRQFYVTPFGEDVCALISLRIARLWPKAAGDALLGVGYAMPYLEACLPQAAPVVVCMPAAQGAVYWPLAGGNRVFLAHESELPLAENSINRALLVHSVEHSEQLSGLMREIWRVLAPGGRVLVITPGRLGFWSRSAISPFGHGRPFSIAQMKDLLTSHKLSPTRTASALFIPPLRIRFLWRMAPALEKIGALLFPFLGGVILLEAEKQVYAAIAQPVHAKKGYRPAPAATPAMTSSCESNCGSTRGSPSAG